MRKSTILNILNKYMTVYGYMIYFEHAQPEEEPGADTDS